MARSPSGAGAIPDRLEHFNAKLAKNAKITKESHCASRMSIARKDVRRL